MTTTTDETIDLNDARFTIPRSKGTERPVSRIQPGWWMHFQAPEGQDVGYPDGWEQVDYVMEACGIHIIVFHGDQPDVSASGRQTAVTLTEREAAKLGLRGEGEK